jgi:hypothetical protein
MPGEIYGERELDAALEMAGRPVRFDDVGASYCGLGIVNETDEDGSVGGDVTMAGHQIVVELKAAGFPGLAADATLNVDDVDYRVVQVRQFDDGALLRVWCARMT